MIKGHSSRNRNSFGCLFQCVFFLLAVLALIPSVAAAQSAAETCIEDGGTGHCTAPQIIDRPGEYTLWEIRDPGSGNAAWSGFNSDQDLSSQIASLAAPCPTNQNPQPPYVWNVQPYNGWDYKVSVTPDISATFDVGNNCTQPEGRAFYGQRLQPLSCPAGWMDFRNTPTANYPFGYCLRPAVQCPQCGQYTLSLGDPIDPAMGNETEHEVDYPGTTASPLRFERFYNYAGTILGPGAPSGAVGQGWSHTYERRLWFYSGGAIRALRPDGDHKVFTVVNGQYQEYGTAVDQLVALQSGSAATGWEFIGSDDTEEFYDISGNLTSITYRGGASVTMSYSTTSTPTNIAPYPGLLIVVADNFGHQLCFTYNSQGEIITVTDPGGAVYTYTYSGPLLSAVEYPDSASRQYIYNEQSETDNTDIPYALTGIIDENGSRYATVQYNYNGQAVGSYLAGGVDQYTLDIYTPMGYINNDEQGEAYYTDPLGTQEAYYYQTINGVMKYKWISPRCPKCAAGINYDSNGNISELVDSNLNETMYSYDLTRNLETSRTEAYGSAQARTIATQWDPNWRQPDLITEPGRSTAYSYDSMGNMLTKSVTDTTSNIVRTWTYTYDSYGRMLTAEDPRSNTTHYTYYTCAAGYQCGQLETVTDPFGHVTTYNSYDGDGSPLTITDPNGSVTTLVYDARERLSSRTQSGETTSFSYYPTGLLDQVTLPDGSDLVYTYDAAHRLTQVSDGLGNKVVYTLDPMGNETAENTYDPAGTLRRTHAQIINTMGEVSQEVDAAGTSAVTTNLAYDANGNATSIDAPLSRNTSESYDALNQVSSITDSASGVTAFGYDVDGDLTSVTDARGLTTSYAHDAFGDITLQVSPDTGATTNSYDADGNLVSSTDARGAVVTYGYDTMNRVTSTTYSLNGTTDQTLSFTYDQGSNGIGHLTGAADANHSMSFNYDALGEMTGMSQTVGGVGRSISYSYTNTDITSIVTPSGQTVQYGYNVNHQITSVEVNGITVLSNVSYEPFGPVAGWTWGNGGAFTRSYNEDGLITGVGNPGSLESISYDNASRISGITNIAFGSSNWTFGYDALDRLTAAANGSITEGWTYDADGNRLSETGSTPSTYSISSTSNEISGITGALTRSFTYDAAGNTLSDSTDADTYNNAGRLKTITNAAGTTTFIYGALGQMIEASGPSGSFLYVYDEAGHLIGEYDGAGNLIQETVWLGDIPVATIQPNGSSVATYYVVTDQVNAPREVIRPSDNTVMWSWFSGPFGSDAPNTNPQGAGVFVYDLRFPGQIAGAWGSTYQNSFRDYDPAVGRYVESDPAGLGGGLNTYAYVANGPLQFTDQYGLMLCGDWGWMAIDWALGLGSRNRTYGGFSDQAREVAALPPVAAARQLYRQKNASAMGMGRCCSKSKLQPVTNYAARFGVHQFIAATRLRSCAWHFLGSFRIDIYPISCTQARFVVTNNSSFTSFAAGHGPSWSHGPGSNFFQTYTWDETF